MPFTTAPWDGSAGRWPDAASYCKSSLVDNNPAGAEKTKTQCHFPVRAPGSDVYNVNALRAVVGGRGAQANFPGAEAARARARRLLAEYNSSQGRSEDMEVEEVNQEIAETLGGYRTSGEFVFRSADGEAGILEGRMLPYNEWARIDSFIEGRFYEQFRPRSLTKHLTEKASQVRILFEHGLSRILDKMPIAQFDNFRDEEDGVHYTARLFANLPPLFMDGLRSGQYGSSIRHKPVVQDIDYRPEKSDHNPEGWQERSITEAMIKEFSVVTFPAYKSATASMRAITDDLFAARALQYPEVLLEHLRAKEEPPHSGPAAEEDPPAEEGSRDTLPKPKRDWLSTDQEVPPWHIP